MIPKSSTHQYNVKTFHYSLFPFEWSNCVYHCNLYVANQDFNRWYLIYYPSHVVLLCPINLEVLEDLINFMVLKIFKSVNGNFYLFVSMKPFHFEVITSFWVIDPVNDLPIKCCHIKPITCGKFQDIMALYDCFHPVLWEYDWACDLVHKFLSKVASIVVTLICLLVGGINMFLWWAFFMGKSKHFLF